MLNSKENRKTDTRDYVKYIQECSKDLGLYPSRPRMGRILYFSLAFSIAIDDKSGLYNSFECVNIHASEYGPIEREIQKSSTYDYLSFEHRIKAGNTSKLSQLEKESIEYIVHLFKDIPDYGLNLIAQDGIFKYSGATPWKMSVKGEREIQRLEIQKFYTQEWFDNFESHIDEINVELEYEY